MLSHQSSSILLLLIIILSTIMTLDLTIILILHDIYQSVPVILLPNHPLFPRMPQTPTAARSAAFFNLGALAKRLTRRLVSHLNHRRIGQNHGSKSRLWMQPQTWVTCLQLLFLSLLWSTITPSNLLSPRCKHYEHTNASFTMHSCIYKYEYISYISFKQHTYNIHVNISFSISKYIKNRLYRIFIRLSKDPSNFIVLTSMPCLSLSTIASSICVSAVTAPPRNSWQYSGGGFLNNSTNSKATRSTRYILDLRRTLPETKIAPEKWWLGSTTFLRQGLFSRVIYVRFREGTPHPGCQHPGPDPPDQSR